MPRLLSEEMTSFLRIALAVSGILAAYPAFSKDLNGSQVFISFKNSDLPASDLVSAGPNDKGEILDPEEASRRHKSGEIPDLSALETDPTANVWKGVSTSSDLSKDIAIPVSGDEGVAFGDPLESTLGHMSFNIRMQSNNMPSITLTVMMGLDIHRYLLRKEILRRLGYRVPGVKYMPKLKVKFPDLIKKTMFLSVQLPNATDRAASRWVVPAPSNPDPLEVTLQDVIVIQPSPQYYNLALGAPVELTPNLDIRPLGPRILRSLAIPYGLVNVGESINQVDWYLGRVQNGAVTLETGDLAGFACTLDDALWMLRRIEKLSREDFVEIVKNSHYPGPVAKVLVEKLIARRNSLMKVFKHPSQPLPMTTQITELPSVKNGKILQQEWPGYAGRLAYGDPQSPLHGLGWYGLSVVESNVMGNLIAEINRQIPSLSAQDQIFKHQQKLQQGITQYMSNGQIQKIPFGTWFAPIANGGIDISRNVVIGNYLGTNNLVQLVDNCGLNINAGFIIGFDGLPASVHLQGLVQGSLGISLTHLKPLVNLKQPITEPLKEEIVPLIFYGASGILKKVAELRGDIQDPVKLKDAIGKDLGKLKDYLAVGESLILTEKLTGVQSLTAAARLPAPQLPSVSVTAGANEIVLSRLHFFRKDVNTLAIFKDNGELAGVSLAFEFDVGRVASFPIISISAKKVSGWAKSEIYNVNIYPDPNVNPEIFALSSALSAALRTGSVEALDLLRKPMRVVADFKDSSSSYQFFHRMHRSLHTDGKVSVQLPNGFSGNFISLTDGTQAGRHYQSLAMQASNYIMQRLTGSGDYAVNTQLAPNAGQSFLGHSQTRNGLFQARLESKLSNPYVRVQHRWEGWDIPAQDVENLVKAWNRKYSYEFFPEFFLQGTQNIKLYSISLSVHFYEGAISAILAMSVEREKRLLSKYNALHSCELYEYDFQKVPRADRESCETIKQFQSALAWYRKGEKDPRDLAADIFQTVSALEQFVDVKELLELIGGPGNIYVVPLIKGFRIGAETLSDPITLHGFGRADRLNPDGILDSVQQILGIGEGEFNMQWIREVL